MALKMTTETPHGFKAVDSYFQVEGVRLTYKYIKTLRAFADAKDC